MKSAVRKSAVMKPNREDQPKRLPEGVLEEWLEGLPPVRPSEGFDARLRQRLEESNADRWSPPGLRPLWWLAAAALLLASTVITARWVVEDRRARPSDSRMEMVANDPAQVRELRQRYDRLQSELVELQRLVAGSDPVIGVEGRSADYVFDLRAPSNGSARAIPVGYSETGQRRTQR